MNLEPLKSSSLLRVLALRNYFLLISIFMLLNVVAKSQVLKVGVVGLSHDHAYGLMNQYKNGEVTIVGIVESDKTLIDRYKTRTSSRMLCSLIPRVTCLRG